MGPFKSSPEDKAAKQAQRAEEKAAWRARWAEKVERFSAGIEAYREQRAEEKFARSPVGLATAAFERGDALFQTSMPENASTSEILSMIEAIGWHLEHSAHTSVASSYTTTDSDGGVTSHVDEELVGTYRFRRS